MVSHRLLPIVVAGALLALPIASQPNVVHPSLDAPELLATGLFASGSSMAVDRFGNVYVLNVPFSPLGGTPGIVRIDAAGAVFPAHATGLIMPGQLARSPVDGLVYMIENGAGAFASFVRLVNAAGGVTPVATIPVMASGFAFDAQGRWIAGGFGPGGFGLYRIDPANPGVATFLDAGFAGNPNIAVLADGSILIAVGAEVRRHVPGTPGTMSWFLFPLTPTLVPRQFSLLACPINALGQGAVVGIAGSDSSCFCGVGALFFSPLAGGSITILADETFSVATGLRAAAVGQDGDLYYYSDATSAPAASLHRIGRVPLPGAPGTLQVVASGNTLLLDLWGSPAGSEPFYLGSVGSVFLAPPAWYPFAGLVGVDPFAFGHVAILDGLGLLGPPLAVAMTDASGHFGVPVPVAPTHPPIDAFGQAFIASASAPNGFVYLSNVEPVIWP